MTGSFRPFDYQIEAAEKFRSYTGTKGGVIVLPTGTGKTKTGLMIALEYVARGGRVLWLAHRSELVQQPYDSLCESWPEVRGGIVQRKRNDVDRDIVFASKDTLLRADRLDQYLAHGAPALVVVDEQHHAPSKSYRRLIERLAAPRLLGLTATPERDDNLDLGEDWEIVYSMSILDALDRGALVPPYAALDLIPGFDLTKIEITGGDYNEGELEKALITSHVVEHTVAAVARAHHFERLPFREHAISSRVSGSGLVFTVTVNQAMLTATALRAAGYKAEVVWGEMPKAKREQRLADFKAGAVQILVNAGVLTEGTDLPLAEWELLVRPTKSSVLYMQILGRVLRRHPGKERGLIVDLCGATKEHNIVKAPVIVAGTDCEHSPTGAHRYHEIPGSAEGRCEHCGQVVRCFKNLGSHVFKGGRCKLCGAEQCPDSPTLEHMFIPWENRKRACIHCGLEIPDPLAALAGREIQYREKVAWKRLQLRGEVYAVDLRGVGAMFMVRRPSGFEPYLFSREKLTRLASGPVDERIARLLTDDVARRATRVKGMFGGQKNPSAMRLSCIRLEALAKRLGLEGR